MTEPKPFYTVTPTLDVTLIAKPGLEAAVLTQVRELRQKRKHSMLIVQLNRDGTWSIFDARPT